MTKISSSNNNFRENLDSPVALKDIMNFNNYLQKLRAKPQKQRERIAAVATGVTFLVILLIWIFTFSELNESKPEENPEQASVSDQFGEVKEGVKSGRESIEEMMQGLPTENAGNIDENDLLNAPENLPEIGDETQIPDQSTPGQSIGNEQSEQPATQTPQLP